MLIRKRLFRIVIVGSLAVFLVMVCPIDLVQADPLESKGSFDRIKMPKLPKPPAKKPPKNPAKPPGTIIVNPGGGGGGKVKPTKPLPTQPTKPTPIQPPGTLIIGQ